MRIDDTRRPSYAAVRSTIAQTRGQCALTPPGWLHTATVTGGLVQFGYLSTRSTRNTMWQFRATAQEGANYSAGLFRVAGPTVGQAVRRAVTKVLTNPRAQPLLATKGALVAYSSKQIALPKKGLRRGGWYVYGVQLSAAMNPTRTLTAISRPFRVVARARR
jgi:hypothetical protein